MLLLNKQIHITEKELVENGEIATTYRVRYAHLNYVS